MQDKTDRDKLKQIINDYLQSRGYNCSNTTLAYDTSITSYINDQLNDTSDIIGEGSGLILAFHCHISTLQTQYKEYLGIQLMLQSNSKPYSKYINNQMTNFSFSLFALIVLLIYESDESEKVNQFFNENCKDFDMEFVEHIEVLKRYVNNKKDISKSKCHIPLMKSILNKHIEIHIPIDFYNKLIEELSNRSLLYLLYLIENYFEFIFIDDTDQLVEDNFDCSDLRIELSSINNELQPQPQPQSQPPPPQPSSSSSPIPIPIPIQQQQQQSSSSSSTSQLTFPSSLSSTSSSSLFNMPPSSSSLSTSNSTYSSPLDPFSISPLFVTPTPYSNNIPIPLDPIQQQQQQQLPPPQQQQIQIQNSQLITTNINSTIIQQSPVIEINQLWGEIEDNYNNNKSINNEIIHSIPHQSMSFPYSALNYEFTSPQNLITTMKISHNNKIIICGYVNGIIEYWNKINESKSNSHKLYGLSSTVLSIDIDYDNEYIIGSDVYGNIMMWSITSNNNQSMAIVKYQGHTSAVFSIKFSPVNYYFASGGHDTTVQIWRTDNYNSLRLFTGHRCEISCLEWFNNGVYLISGDYSGVIRIWDSIKGICTRQLSLCNIRISCINVSLNGKYISFGNDNSEIIIYEIEKGIFFKQQLAVKNKTINSILLLENDNIILYSTNNRLYISSITLDSNIINLNSTQIVPNNSSHIFTLSYIKHHHHILLCSVNFQ